MKLIYAVAIVELVVTASIITLVVLTVVVSLWTNLVVLAIVCIENTTSWYIWMNCFMLSLGQVLQNINYNKLNK